VKVQHDTAVRFSVKIAKVDPETREVEGIATQEVLDAHNQVVDHASMKACLSTWPGNIREMHQAKAVGRAVFAKTDDEQRATILRARVSKGAPDTWEKVLDGTLSAFSIGGTGKVITEKGADGHEVGRIFMQKLTEISLVDNPACPTAQFEIVKSVDGELVGVQPAEPTSVAVIGSGRTELLTKLAGVAAGQQIGHDVTKRAEPYDVQQALQCIAFLESLVANEMFEAEFADVFGDGESDASTQKQEIAYLRAAAQFLLKFLVSEFESQFASVDAEAAVAMSQRRETLTTAVEAFEKAMPPSWMKLDGAGQLWLAKAGARHSKKDVEMIQNMHDTANALGAVCKSADDGDDSDAIENAAKTAAAAAARVQNVEAPAPVAVEQQKVSDTQQNVAPAAAAAIEVVKSDPAAPPITVASVQAAVNAAADGDVIKVNAGTTFSDAETIQKLIESSVQKALEAQEAKHAGVVAELTKRVKDLEDSPMPGGPKTRATGDAPKGTPTEKRFANEPANAGDNADPKDVDALLEKMIADTTDDGQRMLLVERRIAHQRRHGLGQMAMRRETWQPSTR
jgi:hypothetical protein